MQAKPDLNNYEKLLETLEKNGKEMIKSILLLVVQMYQ